MSLTGNREKILKMTNVSRQGKPLRTLSENKILVRKKRMHIAECAQRLFLKNGYHDTNMREIAEACNMSSGAIYRYIGSKEDILHLIADFSDFRFSAVRNYARKLTGASPSRVLRLCIRELIRFCDEDQDLIMFINRELNHFPETARDIILESQVHMMEIFKDILVRGKQAGEFKYDDPKTIAFDIIVAGVNWATWRWFLREQYTLRSYINKQAEIILRAISTDEAPEEKKVRSTKPEEALHR